ncbi:unnamed protein product [Rotaria sp. Silwood2]|nr:unnamed protein product [Rotaria sp. Silwood2]CAF2541792.1 unnamed protein product [Rotaria sp. Silwood2]CAF2793581.1 unnamed protein product [Rotaria sp. Silwood2]CAF2921762.1 unnamed protein product [Rotaria sp. Silwood2]CAF3858017.1 unnamed protein product [Rotaria sp. Silwood2]
MKYLIGLFFISLLVLAICADNFDRNPMLPISGDYSNSVSIESVGSDEQRLNDEESAGTYEIDDVDDVDDDEEDIEDDEDDYENDDDGQSDYENDDDVDEFDDDGDKGDNDNESMKHYIFQIQ